MLAWHAVKRALVGSISQSQRFAIKSRLLANPKQLIVSPRLFTTATIPPSSNNDNVPPRPSSNPTDLVDSGVAQVFFENDKPKMQVLLPDAGLRIFHIDVSRDINFFLLQLQDEDSKVDKLGFYDSHGHRLARSTLMADALQSGVSLVINGRRHPVNLPSEEELTRPLEADLRALKSDLDKLHSLKTECDVIAQRHGNRLMWGGLVALCAQWGLMMRLTWFEYSWDVMEPIAYFLSFGTGILAYIFYVSTRKEYTFENLGGVTISSRQKREYKKKGLDLDKYNQLVASVNTVEEQLRLIHLHKARWWR